MLVLLSGLSTWISLLFVLLSVVYHMVLQTFFSKIVKIFTFSLLKVRVPFSVSDTVTDPVSAS